MKQSLSGAGTVARLKRDVTALVTGVNVGIGDGFAVFFSCHAQLHRGRCGGGRVLKD